MMKDNQYIYTGPLTGTIGEASEQKGKSQNKDHGLFGENFEPIQQMWEVDPIEVEYDGTNGYKEN